jgi:hypothetical protein
MNRHTPGQVANGRRQSRLGGGYHLAGKGGEAGKFHG